MSSSRIAEFDTWRSGYGLASVSVYLAGTNTLASLFSDEDLSVSIGNPQTLIERIIDGVSYGRWAAPVYVGQAYSLAINSVDVTGIQRIPITTLDGEDGGLIEVTPDGASVATALEDLFARRIDVRDFGAFVQVGGLGASTATNTATLTTAIGAAGGRGSGVVLLPAETFSISTFTLPEGVVLEGEGQAATILQSTQAGNVCIIGGTDAGLRKLTLDGITQVALSVGVFAEDRDRVIMEDVLIKRFATGISRNGGNYCDWHRLTVSDCPAGASLLSTDDDLTFNSWRKGGVELCTDGIELGAGGEEALNNVFDGLFFDTISNNAFVVNGAENTVLRNCKWKACSKPLKIQDSDDHEVSGVEVTDGEMNTGTLSFLDTLEKVAFRRMALTDIDISFTTPEHHILVEDCEESGVAITVGDYTAWNRNETTDTGATFGSTTSNGAVRAWATALNPGDHVYLEGIVIGRQTNAVQHGFYHIGVSARRPGSSLAYDTQTSNFAAGRTITGGTSAATAVIQADTDGGTTGTLTLIDIVGNFVDNEIITDGAGGSATVNGALVVANAALVGSVAAIRAAQETNANWAATFAANGPEIELQVTGDTGANVEWTVHVTARRN